MNKAFYFLFFLFVTSTCYAWSAGIPAKPIKLSKQKTFKVVCQYQPIFAANKTALSGRYVYHQTVVVNQTSKQVFSGLKLPKPPVASDYVFALKKVTDVMVNDVASPVAASRYYAYITLAAYETQSLFDTINYPSLAGRINKFSKPFRNDALIPFSNKSLAVILAVFITGQKLLPSGYLLVSQMDSIAKLYSKNASNQSVYKNTYVLITELVNAILLYAKADGFARLNNLKRYTPKTEIGYWKPTPPIFMAPVEPNWHALRTFLIDSAQQFKVVPPAVFDTAHNSLFYTQLMEVYNITNSANTFQKDIAMFWDCNPFAVQQIGHVEFGIKKISPGGHWMGITGIACLKNHLPLGNTILAHVMVSITLADAFIACWDEKYRSNRVRPETVIQKLIDPRWHPLLQTPPFPEYVSGHSVASTAAAIILTKIFGEKFSYADDTEVEFGLPVRVYKSFFEAASEAANSRLYGGIHFRDAIEQGEWQGRKIGEFVSNKFILKSIF